MCSVQVGSSATVGYSWVPILNTGPLTWLHSVTLVRIRFQAYIWIYPTRETGSSPCAVKLLHKKSLAFMAKFEIPPHNISILLKICQLMDICLFLVGRCAKHNQKAEHFWIAWKFNNCFIFESQKIRLNTGESSHLSFLDLEEIPEGSLYLSAPKSEDKGVIR